MVLVFCFKNFPTSEFFKQKSNTLFFLLREFLWWVGFFLSKEEIQCVGDGPPRALLIHVLLKFGCVLSELIQTDTSLLSALKPAER